MLSLKYHHFCNCYLAVAQPTLGHSQGGTLTILMLATALY